MKNLFTLSLIFISSMLCSQDENIRYEDHIYRNNIRTVTFHVSGLPSSFALINLDSGLSLDLGFDDMDGDVKDYVYSIEHCDKDWNPSKNLSPTEYINGFEENDIELYDYSFNTRVDYTHYDLSIPNEDIQFTLSGNYIVKIYEDEDEKHLVLTRRFLVVDPITFLDVKDMRAANVSKIKTHQEIDFVVGLEEFEIRNPRLELSATVLQNRRWDTAIKDLKPKFSRGTTQVFDYTNKIVFPAGKEFRFADLRDYERKTTSIYDIDRMDETFNVILHQDKKRLKEGYFDWPDNNGKFFIETRKGSNGQVRGEYANIFFNLYSPTEYHDADVYIFGGLTDWKIQPHFKMVYNKAVTAYVAKVEMKQGYYDYVYAVVPKGTKKVEFDTTEGDWHEAHNEYLVLVYYRRFGGRYDQLIGAEFKETR